MLNWCPPAAPNKFFIIIGFYLLVIGCAQSVRRSDATGQRTSPTPIPTETSESKVSRPRVAVVFGPGAFKTFAYPSFIKSFVQNGVNPELVFGLEWAALPAAAFALNGKAHEAEWKVFKLPEDLLRQTNLFGKPKRVGVDTFRPYLQENLGTKAESETAIPFRCPTLKLSNGVLGLTSSGPVWRKVEACLALPNRFDPTSAEAPSLLSLVEVARSIRKSGFDVLVLVNVLGQGQDAMPAGQDWLEITYWAEVRRHIWSNLGEFTDVYHIDTSAFGLFDVKAKSGLQAVGEKAGRDAAKDLVEKYQL